MQLEMCEDNVYHELRDYSDEETAMAAMNGAPEDISRMVVGIALYAEEAARAYKWCMKLSKDPNEKVRGNAILGFGHLARRFGSELEHIADAKSVICSRVAEGLEDRSKYVRDHSWSAASDVSFFLGWQIDGFDSCRE